MNVEVFSDGSATTGDKAGGWGYVLVINGVKHSEGSGHMEKATNNDAELEAATQGLEAVERFLSEQGLQPNQITGLSVTLVSDSQLILGWASGTWKFKQIDKMEAYHRLRKTVARLRAKTRWVEGHSGDEHNERCDKLANLARKGVEEEAKREEAKARGETLIGDKKNGILCVWYGDCLKVIDLDTNVVENYNREIHGKRGSALEIRKEKSR
jgi:ribonuclease HI